MKTSHFGWQTCVSLSLFLSVSRAAVLNKQPSAAGPLNMVKGEF